MGLSTIDETSEHLEYSAVASVLTRSLHSKITEDIRGTVSGNIKNVGPTSFSRESSTSLNGNGNGENE